jgi:hypothetical protein
MVEIILDQIHQDKELRELGFVRNVLCEDPIKRSFYDYTRSNVFVNGVLSDIEMVTKIVNWKRYITGVKINGQDVIGVDVLRYEE